jgi:hypothetical protein
MHSYLQSQQQMTAQSPATLQLLPLPVHSRLKMTAMQAPDHQKTLALPRTPSLTAGLQPHRHTTNPLRQPTKPVFGM